MTPLEAELLERFGRGVDAPISEAEFDRLARAVFAWQFERNAPYAAFCRARGRTPESVAGWRDIPPIHTAAFKVADLTTTRPGEARVLYLTSGTTRGGEGGTRGRHLLPDTRLYDASLEPNFRAHVLPDRERIRVLVCGPAEPFVPHSSLGHMNRRILERWGAPGSDVFWREDGPRFPELAAALERAEREGEAVCLLGTAFGFVHFLDFLGSEGRRFTLPAGSRLMDTGGYKGRSREVPKEQLYALYGERLGLPLTHIVNEYGMTELGSQFYDSALRDALAGERRFLAPAARRKLPPPWCRAEVVDPETLEPLAEEERPGLLRFFDLANLHSVSAILTDDVGVRRGGGFEILGRAAGAEPRGCSLAMEDLPTREGRS